MATLFHPKCGLSITLLNGNRTATRNYSEFNFGVVLSSQPLVDNQLFQVKIEKKIVPWTGSIDMGVTACDPDAIEIPPCASDLRDGTWIMSGNSILKDGLSLVDVYGRDLDTLGEGDCLGVMRTNSNKLVFFVNGESQGIAAVDIPPRVFAVVDVYGKCAQVSIVECSNLSSSLSNLTGSVEMIPPERLTFHSQCGDLVRISNNGRTAERTRPLDEFNNGVVMTNRALLDDELFEIRIDQLVVKWSGSIEVGVTTHNPATLTFPATMTNMRSGTTMMSGSGILTNGRGSRREYGDFNLDKLQEGDRIGMMRKSTGDLHYYINGLDQGVAANAVPACVFGVVDLYGMTVKVTIVNRDEREEQNLITRRNTSMRDQEHLTLNDIPEEDNADRLKFHPRCGSRAAVIHNNRTAHRPHAFEDFNNAVVLTNRPLKPNELFEVRLDSLVVQWTGSIEIGVTTHSPLTLEFPTTMTNVRTGTWIMTGKGVMQNGAAFISEYGYNLDKLQVGDRVGVMRKDTGALHFFVNGLDQGEAISNIPEKVYGVVDLYGQVAQVTIVYSDYTTVSESNSTCLNSDMRFYHIHGRNARISNNGRTASRPHAYREYSKAIVICNRPLKENELFEIVIDKMVDRWYGSIEAGVTTNRPDELEFANTMTEIDHGTWMLSGSAVMKDGAILNNVYECDLDTLGAGSRIGMMRKSDGSLHYFLNGVDQGPAHTGLPPQVYPLIDLYGRCAQVSIVFPLEAAPASPVPQDDSGNNSPQQSLPVPLSNHEGIIPSLPVAVQPMHLLSRIFGRNIVLNRERTRAVRYRDFNHGLVLGAAVLAAGELFEVEISLVSSVWAGSLSIGLTTLPVEDSRHVNLPESIAGIEADTWFISGNEVRKNDTVLKVNYCHSLDLLSLGDRIGIKRTSDGTMRLLVNGHDWGAAAHKLPKDVIAVVDLYGAIVAVEMTSHVKASPGPNQLQCTTEVSAISAPVRLASGESPLASPDEQAADDVSRRSSHLLDSLENISTEHRILNEMNDSKHSEILGDIVENSGQPAPPCPPPAAPTIQSNSFDLEEDTVLLEFHENHGTNIVLGDGRRSARRTSGYNHGLVLTVRPLPPSKAFQIRIGHLNTRWVSSVMLGVTAFCPERHSTLPASALEFRQATWLLCGDSILRNGVKLKGKSSLNLDTVCEGSVLGLTLGADGRLTTFLNGVPAMMINTDLAPNMQPCYVLVDLYGQCDEINILGSRDDPDHRAGRVSSLERNIAANNIANAALLASAPQADSLGEKADLETHEKDTSPSDQEKRGSPCSSRVTSRSPSPSPSRSSSESENCIHSNPNDKLNISTMQHSNHVISSPNPFYLNQGLGSQSSNNLSLDSNGGHCNVGLSLSAVFPSTVSILSNSNPNLNSSRLSCSANSSSDPNYSSINRLNSTSVLVDRSSPPSPLTPSLAIKSGNNCAHLQLCTRFKRLIGLPDGFFLRSAVCYCANCTSCTSCAPARARVRNPAPAPATGPSPHPVECEVFECKGEPGVRYSVPFGWCRFPLRRRAAADGHDNWHVAFYGTRIPVLRKILDRGELAMFENLGLSRGSQRDMKGKDDDLDTASSPLLLSPSIKYASTTGTKYEFTDPKSERKLIAQAVFQVMVRPGSYKTCPPSTDHGSRSPDAFEWMTKEKGATVLSALLLRIEGL